MDSPAFDSYSLGRMAYLLGKPDDANPYHPVGRIYAARDWHRGWLAEREDFAEAEAEYNAAAH